jgi:DNA-binding beta-propeller fold protein YncE
MRLSILLAGFCLLASAQQYVPYKILKTAKVGGAGGFDYVYADSANRKLYIPRTGDAARVTVYDLDTLQPAGEIPNTNARGAAVSPKSNHGFASSKPVAMWDAKTLQPIKTIDVDGAPDGIMYDPFEDHVWVFSHRAPNATVINAKDGTVVGTVDLGGAPEQAASDGKGRIYVDLEDKNEIAVVDAKDRKVIGRYDLQGKGGTCAGLALDSKNGILFSTCRDPQKMVILRASDGKILGDQPIGAGTDGAVFNPKTNEVFSSQRDGTLTIVHESNPTTFSVVQTLQTMTGGKTLTFDAKTGHILIIAAEYGQPAPAPAGGRAGRAQMLPDSFTILMIGR